MFVSRAGISPRAGPLAGGTRVRISGYTLVDTTSRMIRVRFGVVNHRSVRIAESMDIALDNLIFDAASRGDVDKIALPAVPDAEYVGRPRDVCGWLEGETIIADVPDLRGIIDARSMFTGEPITVSVQLSLNAGVNFARSILSYTFFHTPTVLGVWPTCSSDCGGVATGVFVVGLMNGTEPCVKFEDIRTHKSIIVPAVVHLTSGCMTCVSPAMPGATLVAVSVSLNGGQQFTEPAGGTTAVRVAAEALDTGVEIDVLQVKALLSERWAAAASEHALSAARFLGTEGGSSGCAPPEPPALFRARPASAHVCMLVRYYEGATFVVGGVGPTRGGSTVEIVGGESLRAALVEILSVVNGIAPQGEVFVAGPTFEPTLDRCHTPRMLPAMGAATVAVVFRGDDGGAPDVSTPAQVTYDPGCGVFRVSTSSPATTDRTRRAKLSLRASIDRAATFDLESTFWFTPSLLLETVQPTAFPNVGGSVLRVFADRLVNTGQARIRLTWVSRNSMTCEWASVEVPALMYASDGTAAKLFEHAAWLECSVPRIPVVAGAAGWAAARVLVGESRARSATSDDGDAPRVSEAFAASVDPANVPNGAAPVFVNVSLNAGLQYAICAAAAHVYGQARVSSAAPFAVPARVPNIALEVHGASFTETKMVAASFSTSADDATSRVLQEASVSASSSVRIDGMLFKDEGLHVVRVSQNGGQDFADGAACVLVCMPPLVRNDVGDAHALLVHRFTISPPKLTSSTSTCLRRAEWQLHSPWSSVR